MVLKITNPKEMHCPNNHPLWKLYHKQVGTETIICCRDCETMTAEYVSDNAKLAPWHDSPDAMVWAEKFVEMHKGKEIGGEDVDAGLMVGWFANAMATQITAQKVHDATEVPLMLDIIEKWHVRLGCTRVCDKMTSELYHYIHSKAEAKSTPQSVMTPPQ